MTALEGMTQARWNAMSARERAAVRDLSGLSAQLLPFKGGKVEVVDMDGDRRCFWVGQSAGWRPCTLELETERAIDGDPADVRGYRSVRLIVQPKPQR